MAVAERDFALLMTPGEDSVRLGVFQSVGARLLPPALAMAAKARPALEVGLVQAERPSLLLPLLAAGELDLAFTEEPPADEQLRHLRLLEDPYVLLVSAAEERADADPIALEELVRLPLLIHETCFHLLRIEKELARSGFPLHPAFRSDDAPTLHGLVAAGAGNALLPRLAANPQDSRVAAVAVDARIPARTVKECLASFLPFASRKQPASKMAYMIPWLG